MSTSTRILSSTVLLLGLPMLALPALSQTVDQDVEEITVQAPAQRATGERTAIGSHVQWLELSSRIDISDLDLSRIADVDELDARIELAARTACEQLAEIDKSHHTTPMELGVCIRKAIHGAETQRENAIAAAIDYAVTDDRS